MKTTVKARNLELTEDTRAQIALCEAALARGVADRRLLADPDPGGFGELMKEVFRLTKEYKENELIISELKL